VLLDDEDEPKE